jgi:hypothetical protein
MDHQEQFVDEPAQEQGSYELTAEADLASILAHQHAGPTGPATRASETHSLQPGTAGWAGFGASTSGDQR